MKRTDSPTPFPEDELGRRIRSLPYDAPDPALAGRIMAGLPPRRRGWLQRLWHMALTPVSVPVSPLAAVTAALVVLITGAALSRFLAGPLGPGPGLGPSGEGVRVVFRFQDPAARAVAVMGTFNDWNPRGYEMRRDPASGQWRLEVRLAPGQHDYVFWIDDHKTAPDPHADLTRQDDFGQANSVLFVKGNHDGAI
jgi:hypothetical protein